jgi:hypothetical protein
MQKPCHLRTHPLGTVPNLSVLRAAALQCTISTLVAEDLSREGHGVAAARPRDPRYHSLTLLAAFTPSVHCPSDGVRRLQCASPMASRCGRDRPTRLDPALHKGYPRRRAAPRPSPLTASGSSQRWPRPRPPYMTAARSQSSGSSSSRASSPPRCPPPGRTCRPSRSRPRRRRRMLRSGTSTPPPPSTSTTRRACPRPRGSCCKFC